MGDPARGQPQQLPIPSGLPSNIRGGLRPITANLGSTTMMPRPPMSQPVYLLPRGNLNSIQPAPQPNLVHVRSLASGQTISQGNGVAVMNPQTRAFSPAVISASNANSNPVEDPLQLVKFLKQLMELSQKKHTGSGIVELVQRLIDEDIDCDSFCTQLCTILNSANKRADVESLIRRRIGQLRQDLASGVCTLPHIRPPRAPQPTPIAPSTVFVSPAIIPASSAPSIASQILPRPPDGLPAGATFQLPQASVPITPLARPAAPLVQNSALFAPRPITTPTIATHLRPQQLKTPSQPLPIRMKAPISPATFQAATGLTPQRGSLFAGATTVRPIYPATPVATIAAAPAISSAVAPPSNQQSQPFFPVSQIRNRLASQLPPSDYAMLTDEAMICLAQGLDTFLRSVLTRVSVVVSHKAVKLSEDPHLKQADHSREQLNYLQRLDEHDKQKQSEMEKELILKAAKSRARNENPDQARLREMANQLKNEQDERERQQQANKTALNAIGLPANRRSRPSLNTLADFQGSSSGLLDASSPSAPRLSLINSPASASRLRLVQQPHGSSPAINSQGATSSSVNRVSASSSRFNLAASLRTRRAGLRDLQVVMSKDPRLCRSRAYFRSHLR